MKVSFEGSKYYANFEDGIFILAAKAKLFLKRQKRRAKLLLRKEDLALYLIITFFWIVFGILTYAIGQYQVASKTGMYSIGDVVWDLKEAYFTSVILAFVVGAHSRIIGYRKAIRAQHEIYVSAMRDFDRLFEPFVGSEKRHYFAFYCDLCLRQSIACVNKDFAIKVTDNDTWTSIFVCISDRLGSVKEEFSKDNIVMNSSNLEYVLYIMDETTKRINDLMLFDSLNKEEIIDISRKLMWIIDYLREPWRADIKVKTAILKRLDKYSENEIASRFYYKMLLFGNPRLETITDLR